MSLRDDFKSFSNRRFENTEILNSQFSIVPRPPSSGGWCLVPVAWCLPPVLPLLRKGPFVALFVDDVGVVQLGGEAGLDGGDVFPAQGVALGELVGRQAVGLRLPGQGVDAVDLVLFHGCFLCKFKCAGGRQPSLQGNGCENAA